MRFKFLIVPLFLLVILDISAQESKMKKFKQLSYPEKCWVIWHPFVAKKALKITDQAKIITNKVKQEKLLKGKGNGDQLDAFRHTFWMATLTQEIGWRKAKKLGKAHEKGNYRTYKRHELENGFLPDKISTEMDLFNNDVGISIGKRVDTFEFKYIVIDFIKKGKCRVIKTDGDSNFLDCEGNIIPKEKLQGKWKNKKCLVQSDEVI